MSVSADPRRTSRSTDSQTEQRWLAHAWGVVTANEKHLYDCVAAGGATPGPGRVDGNELRWPGYLGRHYREERGVLVVGAVHKEASPANEQRQPVIARTNAMLVEATRRWRATGRGPAADAAYLAAIRTAYEEALPAWKRWQRHFRPLVEDHLGLDHTQVAYANLAKCRVPLSRSESKVTKLCQRAFPMTQLVEAIRPQAALVAVLHAGAGGNIVSTWRSAHADPVVVSWFGRTGHDQHNTDPHRRKFEDWAPEAAKLIRARLT
jgi:hypothetical protein